MVTALKANPGGLGQFPALSAVGSLEGEEKAAFDDVTAKVRVIALATTGENLDNVQQFQISTDMIGWFMARRPLRPENVAMYVSRYAKIDQTTVEKWRAAQGKSGTVGNSPTLTLSAIVFQEFLWTGSDWKKGNPDQALARLGTLSADAVLRWASTAKSNGNEAYGTWTLLAVDGLFVNDSFQQSAFDAAYPIAVRLLSSR